MLINNIHITKTASSGDISENTPNVRGLCHQIVVKPATETTTYDIIITNYASAIVYKRTSETGTLAEFVSMPLKGIYTVTIDNSTRDERFDIMLIQQE